MSEMICKNCGKEVKQVPIIGIWVHADTGLSECYPNTHAELKEEKCQARLFINNVKYECEREYDHEGMHKCSFLGVEIKW